MNTPAERTCYRPHRRKTPSFSSSLLDSISRSIEDFDQSTGLQHEYDDVEELFHHHHRKSTSARPKHRVTLQQEIPSLGREIMMEKQIDDRRNRSRNFGSYNSSSSGSSSGATFSSSSESEYNICSRSTPTPTPSSYQIRHAIFPSPTEIATCFEQKPKRAGEGKFIRMTKLRALKIYGDLKKVKQPISPGGRISNFLNSILGNSRYQKNAKLGDHESHAAVLRKSRSVKDLTTTTKCSNSISRPCLSEIPPPLPLPLRDSSTSTSKRSIRFYPVNVIVDDDSRRHCGEKKGVYKIDPSRENLSYRSENVLRNFVEEDEHDDDDNDNESCSSSDLFELEIVGGVGIGAYREELPVFGTTNLETNIAIANGFIR